MGCSWWARASPDATAVFGNDLATLPDFPAEIRAPAGTPAGVSAFQIHFASRDIITPGDHPDVLVAMNPAALKANLEAVEARRHDDRQRGRLLKNNLKKAGYEANPLEDGSLDEYTVFRVPMTSLTVRATEDIEEIMPKDAQRAKNLFALGLISWMYGRPTDATVEWIKEKFAAKPADPGGQPGRLPRRLELRRDHRAARGRVRGEAGAGRAGHLPQHQRPQANGARADRGEREVGPAAVLRELPDHAGIGAPARALAAQPASASARCRPRTRSPR